MINPDTVQSSNVLTASTVSVSSNMRPVIEKMCSYFGNKIFIRSKAQGFPNFPLVRFYNKEEHDSKKTMKCVQIGNIIKEANVIKSQVVYQLKHEDDKTFKLKVRIAPHGNEDTFKNDLRNDVSMCGPVGMRLLLATATIFKRKISKINVKIAILQSGKATRNVYVVPPKERNNNGNLLWLLSAVSYDLVNANEKWKVLSDFFLLDNGFTQVSLIPRLFMIKKWEFILLVSKNRR